MAKLTCLSEVGIFTRDLKLSQAFYTRKIGLAVRSSMPKIEYLQLGATKGGKDAGLDLWHPVPSWGEPTYQDGLKSIGTVAGLAFTTGNLPKTVENLGGKGVKVETQYEGFARFWDPDGNTLFVTEQERPKVRRAGLQKLDWVTVVTRDEAKSGEFFRTLGMKRGRVRGRDGETYTQYKLSPEGTAVLPFRPTREMYDEPSDYDADMAHIGENTSIGFEVDDVEAVQEKLLSKGITVKERVTKQSWGGTTIRVLDPDGNEYLLYKMD